MRIELYREEDAESQPGVVPGDYRWRIWESSDVIGGSTEGYVDRRDMIHNLLAILGGTLKRRRDELVVRRPYPRRGLWQTIPVKDLTGDDDDS